LGGGASNGRRLTRRAACMRRGKCIRKLVEKSEGKGPYGRPTNKMECKEIGCEGRYVLDPPGSGSGPVVVSCDPGK